MYPQGSAPALESGASRCPEQVLASYVLNPGALVQASGRGTEGAIAESTLSL